MNDGTQSTKDAQDSRDTQDTVTRAIQSRYGAVARSALSGDDAAVRSVARAFGYSEADLAAAPAEANLGLSCGNPVAVGALRPGETVVDLGSGGGLDVILAASRVGPGGKAIGIDSTPEMVERARRGARKAGVANAEFQLAPIDQIPLPDASVDCVLSNCVINLTPDKGRVFQEIFRILKPGGRVAISDIALRQPLPPEVAEDLNAHVGCIAGALPLEDYAALLQAAGFEAVVVTDSGADLNAYARAGSGCCSPAGGCCGGAAAEGGGELLAETEERQTGLQHVEPTPHEGLSILLERFDANAYAASVRVHAVKPAAPPAHASRQGAQPLGQQQEGGLEVYDRAMCCPTGVCGPAVDPELPRFAADLEWLRRQGHTVTRFNLAQDPAAFARNEEVRGLLAAEGTSCLPLIVVRGRVVGRGEYPAREQLARWASLPTGVRTLPEAPRRGAGCGEGGCC